MYLMHVVSDNKEKKYCFDNLIKLLNFIKNWWISIDDEILFVEYSLFYQ